MHNERLSTPRGHALVVRAAKAIGQIVAHIPGGSEPPDSHIQRAVQPDLDELAFGEVPTKVVVDGVVDGEMVGRDQVGEAQRGSFGIGEIARLRVVPEPPPDPGVDQLELF